MVVLKLASNLSCILAIEQIAYSGTGAWWLVALNNCIPECIAHFGSEEIKGKYLRSFCEGTSYASIQFTEEKTGSDPKMLTTISIPDGESYVINGMKRFTTFGARDGYAITYTKDNEGSCTAFVLEKNVEGYLPSKVWKLMGGGGIEAVDVCFEDVRVPKENLLGKKGVPLVWGSPPVRCPSCNRASDIPLGAGYLAESVVQRYFRDAILGHTTEGTTEIQQLVIARELGL